MVPGQSFEYTLDITTLLHGDDSKLILFVDPDKECFGCVVEDTTAFWPVTFHTSYLQVWISRHEEEVIIDQLLSDLLVHASQWVVVSGKITLNDIKLLIFILKFINFFGSYIHFHKHQARKVFDKYLPENLAKAPCMSFSTPTRCSLVIPGERPNPWMDRPTRILKLKHRMMYHNYLCKY